MPSTISDYRNLIEQPWGKMFYDLIFSQLNLTDKIKLNILDFGAGFCVTANYYAANHNVIAVEPSSDMYNLRVCENDYLLIKNDISYLKNFADNSFDVVVCHNVLEYTQDKEHILQELSRVLKSNGILSIVKHNLNGRIFANAVFADNPKAATELLNNQYDNQKNMFGNRDTYSNDYLISTLKKFNLSPVGIYGIRTFFALSANNDIKYTDEWYSNMLELEKKASNIDEFRKIAFFNHLIFKKFKEKKPYADMD